MRGAETIVEEDKSAEDKVFQDATAAVERRFAPKPAAASAAYKACFTLHTDCLCYECTWVAVCRLCRGTHWLDSIFTEMGGTQHAAQQLHCYWMAHHF